MQIALAIMANNSAIQGDFFWMFSRTRQIDVFAEFMNE